MKRVLVGVFAAALAGAGFWVAAGGQSTTGDGDMAAELIDKWVQSVGGMEAYWGMQSATYTLTTEMYDVETGRLRRTRPRYVTIARTEAGEASRIERWEGDDLIKQGFDGGDRLWATMNGETLSEGDKDYDEALYVARDVFYWISLPFKLKDPGVYLHYDGTDASGRHVVRVTFGQDVGEHDDTWFYTFEEGRTLPVEVAYREEGRTNLDRLRWEDIQDVDGYMFAGRRVHFNDDGALTKVLATTDFVLNPTVSPEVFITP